MYCYFSDVFNNDIFKALTTIPNFLEKELVSSLQGLIKLPTIPLFPTTNDSLGLGGLMQALDPRKFSKYIQVPANDFQAAFSKIAEATSESFSKFDGLMLQSYSFQLMLYSMYLHS